MKYLYVALIALALVVGISACGNNATSKDQSAAPSGSTATVSKYDAGPRAAASPVQKALAERGEKLFKDKGCSACHTWGKKMSGPDLAGVTQRRTAQWMENQILHPEVMTREDPISHDLLTKMMLQMPNQGLTPDEAKSVIEFLKHKDAEVGESHE